MERYLSIGKTNLKCNLIPHILISFVLLMFSPLLMGVENLDASMTAKVLEMYVALIGIILLTPLLLPEQNKEIKDLVESKYTPGIIVYLIRLFEASICLILLIGGYVAILKYNNCVFPEIKFFLGTLTEAIFLGAIGFCAYSLCEQIAISYMLPIVYYVMAIGGGKKLLGDFYLFSMIYGSYEEKVNLAVTGMVLLVVGFSYPNIRKKLTPYFKLI